MQMRSYFGILLVVAAFVLTVKGQTTIFTYQGRLTDGALPANGTYQMQFSLYDAAAVGTQQGSTITNTAVAVSGGVFTVQLDFSSAPFAAGADRWLEIGVRKASDPPGYTTLAPRQQITSGPYSNRSLSAGSADNATQLGGVAANQFVVTGDARLSDARPPTAGSANYIQNTISAQASSNFNISGNGTAGGTLSSNIVNATTQFNLGGSRVLSSGTYENLFAGIGAGTANTAGFWNTFVGQDAGKANEFGPANSFFGRAAGFSNRAGADNAFFGSSSGGSNDGGAYNTFVGANAGYSNTNGSSNVIIGFAADVGFNNLTNASAIGQQAFVTQSSSMVLGSINGVNGATADTAVGIGTTAPAYPLSVVGSLGSGGNQATVEFSSAFTETGVRIKNTATNGRTWSLFSAGGTTGLCQGCFTLWDATAGQARLTADTSGNVGIGTTAPTSKLHVVGTIRFDTLGVAGSTQLCQNGSNQISTCSSSARYKNNINAFTPGLSLIKRLRPVSFNWRDGGMLDMGLVAEEVNKVEPLLTTTNASGQVEGVKYDRVGVVLVNAVKEQQVQIESLEKQNESQQKQIEQQRVEIDALKVIVCKQNPNAQLCKRRN
jgi:hypothetical protein